MKPGIPWSVKGIGPEAREAAKDAARRSGMTLGEWLNAIILEQQGGTATPASADVGDGSVQSQLDALSEQIRRLANEGQDTAVGLYPGSSDTDRRLLEDIAERVNSNERYTVEALTAVNDRLVSLAEHIGAAAKAGRPVPAGADGSGFKALEGALRNIVEHIEVSDRRTRDTLKSVQDRLSDLAHKAQTHDDRSPDISVGQIEDLDHRVSQLSERLDQASAAAPQQDVYDFIESQVADLSQRMEAVRHSAESFAQRAERAAVATTRGEIEGIAKHLESMVEQTQAQMRHHAATSSDLAGIRAELGGLDQRIDDIKAESASERDLHALRVSFEQLSNRMAQAPGANVISDLEQRLANLTMRLEQTPSVDAIHPYLHDLETRIADLDVRMAEAANARDDGEALTAIERTIETIHQRLGSAEERLNGLLIIENSIQQLHDSFHETRDYVHQVADSAAERAAQQAIEQHKDAETPTEILALEQALESLREQAAQSDQQTQETLEAVHDTLEHIVNKLAELETQRGAGLEDEAQLEAEAEVFEDEQHGDAIDYAPEEPPPESHRSDYDWQSTVQAHLAREAEGLDHGSAHLDSDQESELAPAEEYEIEHEEQEERIELPPLSAFTANGEEADDYIAAARHAAQAAADAAPAALDEDARESAAMPVVKAPKLRGLSLSFLKRRTATPRLHGVDTTMVVAGGAATKDGETKRKRLIVAALLVLAAVSAFTLRGVYESVKSSEEKNRREQIEDRSPTAGIGPIGRQVDRAEAVLKSIASTASRALESTIPIGPKQTSSRNSGVDLLTTGSLPPVSKHRIDPQTVTARPPRAAEDLVAARREELPPAIGTDTLREAALKGNAAAQFIVATRYLGGKAIEPSLADAAKWYEKAAAQGLAPAQYRLATLYERGKGVRADAALAKTWYERAARQGNVRAMHNLAVLLVDRAGGRSDYESAATWFRSAAERGLPDSQFNLGILHERGYGVPQDDAEAYFWYSAASRQGDDEARQRADGIQKKLPLPTKHAIDARIQTWRALDLDPAANAVVAPDASWQAKSVVSSIELTSPPTDVDLAEVQSLLKRVGIDVGEADGRMGMKTENGVRLFQLRSGLPVMGVIDAAFMSKLQQKRDSLGA